MNMQEFAALKVGDKVTNEMTATPGEIVSVEPNGVRVVWGERHDRETRFFFSVISTAWMHWSKADD